MDFAPLPDRDNFRTEDEYKKATEKWEREFKRALKKYRVESQSKPT